MNLRKMKSYLLICAIFAYLYAAQANVYLEEKFSDGKFPFSIIFFVVPVGTF